MVYLFVIATSLKHFRCAFYRFLSAQSIHFYLNCRQLADLVKNAIIVTNTKNNRTWYLYEAGKHELSHVSLDHINLNSIGLTNNFGSILCPISAPYRL